MFRNSSILVTPNITNVLEFLSNLYDQGVSYSAIMQ